MLPEVRCQQSVSAEHKILKRHDECLEPQNQGVDKCERIDDMQRSCPQGARVLGHDDVVVAGIGVCDADAAGRHAIEAPFVERLEKHQQGAGTTNLLHVQQLFTAADCPAAM